MHADATAVTSMPSDEFFLARQPILGRDQRLVAFELLFRAAPAKKRVPAFRYADQNKSAAQGNKRKTPSRG